MFCTLICIYGDCNAILLFTSRKIRARSIRPKFPEIPVQNRMEQTFPGNSFRKFGSPLEVVLFPGNLEIPEISCSIWHFYPVWICPSSFNREKLQDGSEPFESTPHGMQNNVPQFEPVLDCLFSPRSDLIVCKIVDWSFRISWGLVRSVCILPGHTFPREKFASCSHHAKMVFSRSGKYWGKILHVLNLFLGSNLRCLKQPLFHDPSAFCRVKCA